MLHKKNILLLSCNEKCSSKVIYCIDFKKNHFIIAGNKLKHKYVPYDPRIKSFMDIPFNFANSADDSIACEIILEIVVKEKIDIVMPSDFDSLKFLSRTKYKIEKKTNVYPLENIEKIELLDHKYKCCHLFEANGIYSPKTFRILSLSDLILVKKQFDFPFLIKPCLAAGGEGIVIVRNIKDYEIFISELTEDDIQRKDLIAQEFIEGIDYVFSAFSINGKMLAWTIFRYIEFDKNASKGTFAEFISDESVLEKGSEIVKASNYTGPIVVDFRKEKSSNKVYLIEINPRFGNNTYYSIIDGINFTDVGINWLLNPSFSLEPKNKAMYSCNLKRLFTAPVRKMDLSAIVLIAKVGIPQVIKLCRLQFYKLLSATRFVLCKMSMRNS